jgi:hypothetical protein
MINAGRVAQRGTTETLMIAAGLLLLRHPMLKKFVQIQKKLQ